MRKSSSLTVFLFKLYHNVLHLHISEVKAREAESTAINRGMIKNMGCTRGCL